MILTKQQKSSQDIREKDADSYLRLIREFDELKPMLGRARSQPLGMGPSLKSLLEKHNRGAIWLRRQSMSAKDVILREFESKHVRAFMGWMSFQTAVPIDQAGTGFFALSNNCSQTGP